MGLSDREVKKVIRLSLLRTLFLSAFALVLPVVAAAQTSYPRRPVRLILPFGAGGIADITARLAAEKIGDRLGQRIVIENQPGAGGVTAARSVLQSPPNGYTLALLSNGTAISVPLFKALPFDPLADFAPVSSFAEFDFIFAVNSESKYKSMQDVIAAARDNPGKLNVGTINVGSSQNLSAELFKSAAGVTVTIVPYRSTPEVLVGLLRNDIDVMIDTYAALRSALTENKLRAIASSGTRRSPALSSVPTVQDSGVAGFDVVSWNGMFAPAKTPADIIETLRRATEDAVNSDEVKSRYAELGVEAKSSTPEDLRARLKNDIEKWSAVIERAGIPKQ
jgi:tripartite-type tricarboxylate transporter receptor subunit TctC